MVLGRLDEFVSLFVDVASLQPYLQRIPVPRRDSCKRLAVRAVACTPAAGARTSAFRSGEILASPVLLAMAPGAARPPPWIKSCSASCDASLALCDVVASTWKTCLSLQLLCLRT